MMLRGVLAVAAMAAGLFLTREAFWGCTGLALVWLACLLLFDLQNGRRFLTHAVPTRRPGSIAIAA